MTQTELQKLKQEYAEGEISEQEFERRLDEVDLDATPPTFMVVLPSLVVILALLWLLWWVVKNDV